MGPGMRVVVEMYGAFQRLLEGGRRRTELEVEENTTVRDVLLKLGMDLDEPWNASLNGTLASATDIVPDGAVLIVFPPITGGE